MAYPTLAMTKEGTVGVRLTPCTVDSDGAIATFGTYRDFIATADPEAEYKNTQTEQEFYERRLSTGMTVKASKTNAYRDATTGAPTAAASEGGDTFKFTFLLTYDDIKYFKSLMTTPVPVVITYAPIQNLAGGVPGWAHLLCKFSGNFAVTGKEGIAEVTVTFEGGVGYTAATGVDYADFNTAAVTAHTFTPFGYDSADALTIAPLVTGDNTDFFSGVTVLKDAA